MLEAIMETPGLLPRLTDVLRPKGREQRPEKQEARAHGKKAGVRR